MSVLKMNAKRLMTLFVLPCLWSGSGQCQAPPPQGFTEEMARQQAIYHGRGEQRLEGYVIDRSLLSYIHVLPSGFAGSLGKLGPSDRWLDIGAGRGKAMLDYQLGRYEAVYAESGQRGAGKASCVAMSIEDRRTAEWHQAAAILEDRKIQYWSGRPMRDYSAEELGRFKLVTDVIGGFSYTSNLSRFMEQTLAALAPGGDFYTLLQDVHSQEGTNKPYYEGSPYLTEIVNADGSKTKLCSWLGSIGCVQVTCELRGDWTPPVEVYHVRKVCEDVKVPALVPVHYEAGTPPERRFQLKSASTAPSEPAR